MCYTSFSIILVCVNYAKCLQDSPSRIIQMELVRAITVSQMTEAINSDLRNTTYSYNTNIRWTLISMYCK
jgi:hypothetical protein